MKKKKSTVIGVFPKLEQAEAAIEELLRLGFRKDDIGFLMRETDEMADRKEVEAHERAMAARTATGAVAGSVLAGLIGVISSIALPGVGTVLTAGLLMAAGGALAGGFAGYMSTLDLPEEEIAWYHGELHAGRPIVVVKTDSRYSEALSVLQVHGAYDMAREQTVEEVSAEH
jgi:hypothetical protein